MKHILEQCFFYTYAYRTYFFPYLLDLNDIYDKTLAFENDYSFSRFMKFVIYERQLVPCTHLVHSGVPNIPLGTRTRRRNNQTDRYHRSSTLHHRQLRIKKKTSSIFEIQRMQHVAYDIDNCNCVVFIVYTCKRRTSASVHMPCM